MNTAELTNTIIRHGKTHEECAKIIGCSLKNFEQKRLGHIPFGIVEVERLSDFLCLPGEMRSYIFFDTASNGFYRYELIKMICGIDENYILQWFYEFVKEKLEG